MKRLFLLDAYALIFRAYYALIKMPRITQNGFNTSAIFGFVNTLEEVLRRENPSHIAVCFDPQGPTFRSRAFEDYKGERDSTPEDIKLSVPIIKDIIRAYNIPILEADDFEADDVIGTMAKRAEKEGFTTYMMTPDKDFGQLVTPSVLQYKPSYRGQDFELRGEQEVCARYGIKRTSQVIDLLALMGDKIDNIPGCPGVGEKTAVKLIQDFDSVENLLENTALLKGALKLKVENNADQIKFSKYLATIRTDVPIDATPDSLERRSPDREALMKLFDSLEFRQLAQRVAKRLDAESSTSSETPDETPAQPQSAPRKKGEKISPVISDSAMELSPEIISSEPVVVDSPDKLKEMQDLLLPDAECGIYPVTEGDNDVTVRWLGTAVALPSGKSFYIPTPEDYISGFTSKPDKDTVAIGLFDITPDIAPETTLPFEALLDLLARPDITKVSDVSKLLYVLGARSRNDDAVPLSNYYDVALAHYLLQPDMRHSLPELSSAYLNHALSLPELPVAKKRGKNVEPPAVPAPDELAPAACTAALAALKLKVVFTPLLEEEKLDKLFYDLELPLVPVLADMELTGVCLDVRALREAAGVMEKRLDVLEAEIHQLAGEPFNVGSPMKVGEILFDKLQLDPKAKKTKTGQYSTSEDVLEKVAHKNPIVGKILEYRHLKKLLNTYLTALPEAVNPVTGRVHTNYNQTVTATGRISSSNPNLQNIPVREEVGREIRKAFIPSPGNLFLSADYSQIELRLVADFADDETMLDAFRTGKDIHAITAAKIYHRENPEEVTADERRNAKTANFGILYGISAFGLASRLGIPRAEASELIDNYFATFPTIRKYMSDSVEHGRENLYVETRMGRKRRLPDINSKNPVVRGYAERNAINAPVQGSAADIIKRAMVDIWRAMKEEGMKSKMIMQVHDELNFDTVPEELPRLQALVTEKMEGAYHGRVTLTASSGVATNWLDAH